MKVGAIIITYNPVIEIFSQALNALLPQVDRIFIIDNSNNDSIKVLANHVKIVYKPLFKNIGIAAAQNIGIKYFSEQDYDYILFSDQDSVAPSCIVNDLIGSYLSIKDKVRISAIGPLPINRKTGKPYLYNDCIIAKENTEDTEYYEMHSIISSFSLVPITNFNIIGKMDENLFIDFVDQEWCWRARYYHKMSCILIPHITISHELGVSRLFLGRQISVSSPFRIYFQTRNLLWLCRKEYVPLYWKKKNTQKLIPKIIYYSLFSDNKWLYIKRIYKGVIDGINGIKK